MELTRLQLIELERRREARNRGYHLECQETAPRQVLAVCTGCTSDVVGDRWCRPCARKRRICRRCGEKIGEITAAPTPPVTGEGT